MGRMLTTILPLNGPALAQSIWVRYIGTLTPSVIDDVMSLLGHYAFTPDTVLRHIGADIDGCAQSGQGEVARLLADSQERAGLRVLPTEGFKVSGGVAGQYDDIALHKPRGQSGGLPSEL